MNTPRKSAFERCALASGLLNEEQIRQARAAIERSEQGFPGVSTLAPDQLLADKLVELGSLNVWQAKQLSAGRTRFDLGQGAYRIVDSIGKGGMGEVYKAEHGVLRRTVAIKVLPRHRSSPEDIANFLREARTLARLDHVNLVRAFDAGEDQKVYYLVTEYVPGTDLRKLVRAKGPLGMAEAANIVVQIARALEHAHAQGMIHRDVKPGNILVTPEGRAKLSDLGLAGPVRDGTETDPRFGRLVGTPDYLSPDHIEAPWNPTPAWDIYSLGCTLYYCVTGKVPFPGGTTADKCRAHLQLRPLDPRRLNPSLSAAFVDVIGDIMAKNPAERVHSAKDVVERLTPWIEGRNETIGNDGVRPDPVSDNMQWTANPYSGTRLEPHTGLEETQASVPAIADLPTAAKNLVPQTAQTTQAVASATEETQSHTCVPDTAPAPATSVLAPFAVLFLFPLAVVATILAVWWIWRLLF